MWGDPTEVTALKPQHGTVEHRAHHQWLPHCKRAVCLAAFSCVALFALHFPSSTAVELDKSAANSVVQPAKDFNLPSYGNRFGDKHARALAKLDEEIQLEKQMEAVLQQLRSENAKERNQALREYLDLSRQNTLNAISDFVTNIREGMTHKAKDTVHGLHDTASKVGGTMEKRLPTLTHLAQRVSSAVANVVFPPVRETASLLWAAMNDLLAPVVRPVVVVSVDVVKRLTKDAIGVAGDAAGVAAATLHATVGKHPRKAIALAAAGAVYEQGRRARVEAGQTGWAAILPGSHSGLRPRCPEGMMAVSVIGTSRPQCAQVPVCIGASPLGNCPPVTPEFPYQSSCRMVADNIYGCVLDELEAPLDEEVQT